MSAWDTSGRRLPLLLLLALALLLKVLVPVGWMPALKDHGIELAPCGDWARVPVTTLHVMPGGDENAGSAEHRGHGQDDRSTEQPCSFAAAGLAWTGPDPLTVSPTPLPAVNVLILLSCAAAVGRGLAAPPPPSTGPPFLS